MFEPSISISQRAPTYAPNGHKHVTAQAGSFPDSALDTTTGLLGGLVRRLRRERRRRQVGRAYDMALEVARAIPEGSEILDVGCGNGFIAHHLKAMLGAHIVGVDVNETLVAPIEYRGFDGMYFPVPDRSFDAVLLCYVLHHMQDLGVVMGELRRVLRDGGLAVVYEDTPENAWDRFICSIHDRKWRNRTGPCTFHHDHEWRTLFNSVGLEIVRARPLSRWRNFSHPVCRQFYVLKLTSRMLKPIVAE